MDHEVEFRRPDRNHTEKEYMDALDINQKEIARLTESSES
jgi:hypothetical protein